MPNKKLLIAFGVAVIILIGAIVFDSMREDPEEEAEEVPAEEVIEPEEIEEEPDMEDIDTEEGDQELEEETQEDDEEAATASENLEESFQKKFYETVNIYFGLEDAFLALDEEGRKNFEVTYNYITDNLDEIEKDVLGGNITEEEKTLLEELQRDISDLKEEITEYDGE